MKRIFKQGQIEIWRCVEWRRNTLFVEYLVYGVTLGGDPIACPSEGMAYEVAAR